jgi:hypothetical protein
MTGQWLAQQLHVYGIRPKTMRIGKERAKGYEYGDFLEAFRRYIPRTEIEAFKAEVKAPAEAAKAGVEEKSATPPKPEQGEVFSEAGGI